MHDRLSHMHCFILSVSMRMFLVLSGFAIVVFMLTNRPTYEIIVMFTNRINRDTKIVIFFGKLSLHSINQTYLIQCRQEDDEVRFHNIPQENKSSATSLN